MEDAYVLQLLEPKFKEFHLLFCGYAECKPLHSYGPATRPNYIIHYVMGGKGIYQVGEKKYHISKGQIFLIEPESLTFYQADKEEPWTYLWVGFGGTEAKSFIQDVGLNSRQLVCQCEGGEELKEMINDGNINDAEDILYEYANPINPDILKVGLFFYYDLNRMADAELEAADFTRDEVKEGVQELLKIYDQENFGTIFR